MGNFRFLVVVRLSFAREQYSELSSIAVCNPVVFEVFLENAEGNPGSCHIPATMATAVREEWNDRRPPERAARESNRGGEASSAARKQRSRPLTYKGGAWKLFPKCSTLAFALQTHLMPRPARHARSDTARRGTREARNARAMVAIERRRHATNISRVYGPFSPTFCPPLFPNRSHGRRV